MTSENELASVLKLVMDRSNAKIRTALPGRVLSFDPDKQRATCQVSVQSYFFDVDEEEPSAYQPPPIANCPVQFPAGGGFSMRFPLKAGDDCLVLVAERSIDEWMATGQSSVIPRDLRRFDLTDAIVIPGLRPAARPHENFNPDSLDIGEDGIGGMRIELGGGRIKIHASSTEMLSVLSTAFGAANTLATALQVAWTASATYAAAAGTGWTALGQTAASTAAGTWGTAAGVAATACGAAASAFASAQTSLESIRKV